MSRRDSGPPPEDDAAREASPTCPGTASKGLAKTHTRRGKRTTGDRHAGRYAEAWRDGFGRGFRDALGLAGREIEDPHAWWVLSRLADEYALAAGDG
jgi:hypothetical protein